MWTCEKEVFFDKPFCVCAEDEKHVCKDNQQRSAQTLMDYVEALKYVLCLYSEVQWMECLLSGVFLLI